MESVKPEKESKKKPSKVLLYDADASQIIPLKINIGRKSYQVSHKMKPLSDDRFFALESELAANNRRIATLSSDLYSPKHNLWTELVEGQSGYQERADWKDKVYANDCVQAVNALLGVEVSEADRQEETELLNFDELAEITLTSLFNGESLQTSFFFREETKDELDEYLGILNSEPQKNVLASAKKKSVSQRFCELYDLFEPETKGYAGRVPAWHKVQAIKVFFEGQMARLGKF